jgi:hypothetical protein
MMRSLPPPRSRAAAFAPLAIVGLTLVMVFAPYLHAAATAAQAGVVFGGHLIGVEDGYSYLGKMRRGAEGEWRFSLFYTAEVPAPPPSGLGLFTAYYAAGWAIGLLVPPQQAGHTEALILGFHALRVVANLLMLWATWRFVAYFLEHPSARAIGFALAVLGGGLGWLIAPLSAIVGAGDWLGSPPAEFFIPEGFSFLTLLSLPHLALGRAALLAALLYLFAAAQPGCSGRARMTRVAAAGALLWGVGLAVPFFLAVFYALCGAWCAAAWAFAARPMRGAGLARRVKAAFPAVLVVNAAAACALSLPLFLFLAWQFAGDTLFASWSAQNRLPSPHPLHYAAAYVLVLVPAVWGVRWAWKRAAWAGREHLLVLVWPPLAAVLVYLPILVQRRLSEGVLVALAVLAAAGLSSRRRPRMAWAWVAAASLSSLFLTWGAWLTAGTGAPPVFQPRALAEAAAWLNTSVRTDTVWATDANATDTVWTDANATDANATDTAWGEPGRAPVVIAAPATGNMLPAFARVRVVMGHGPETLGWPEKRALIERFYAGAASPDDAARLFGPLSAVSGWRADQARYLIDGPNEQAYRPPGTPITTLPGWPADAVRVYARDGVAIWRLGG